MKIFLIISVLLLNCLLLDYLCPFDQVNLHTPLILSSRIVRDLEINFYPLPTGNWEFKAVDGYISAQSKDGIVKVTAHWIDWRDPDSPMAFDVFLTIVQDDEKIYIDYLDEAISSTKPERLLSREGRHLLGLVEDRDRFFYVIVSEEIYREIKESEERFEPPVTSSLRSKYTLGDITHPSGILYLINPSEAERLGIGR